MASEPLTVPADPRRNLGVIAISGLAFAILLGASLAGGAVWFLGGISLEVWSLTFFGVSDLDNGYGKYEAAPRILQQVQEVGYDSHGGLFSLALLVSAPVAFFLAVALARLHGGSYRDFLGLRWPTARQALAWTALILSVHYSLSALLEAMGIEIGDESHVDLYRTAVFLPLLYLAMAVAGPVFEEILFRGFLLEGWRRTRLGTAGAVVLTAALWTLLHSYGIPALILIFCNGILLAVARLRTGSTYLTIGIHGLVNLLMLVDLGFFLSHHGTEYFQERGREGLAQERYWEAFLDFRQAERYADGPCVECQLGIAQASLASFEPRRAATAAGRVLESKPRGEEARRARVLLCLARSKNPLPLDSSLEDLQPNERPEAGRPVAGTGGVERPRLLRYEEPVYPEAARLRRHQGSVIVQAVIDQEGCVTSAQVLRGTAPDLDAAALEAVWRWVFQPATYRGQPVKVYYSLTVNFQLE